jgi:hypothetical protein
MLQFAANERSALGRILQTGRERQTSRIMLSFSPSQRTQLSTKTNLAAKSVHLP